MPTTEREPGSFRDPSSTIFYEGDRVLRGLDATAAADWHRLKASTFFPSLVEAGSVVGTVEASSVQPSEPAYALVLEHQRIPFVSYPYEWTFAMLQDAAVLHLEILLAALADDFTMKDGYAFNLQWQGARPIFIDLGSFEPVRPGPWIGYAQFCRTMLYPLLLESHLGLAFQRYLLGHLEGLDPADMRAIFSGRKRFKKGVFRHVYLHAVARGRVGDGGQQLRSDLGSAGVGKELTKATVTKLLKLVRGLRLRRGDSAWRAYRDTCSYSDDDRTAKERFIRDVGSESHRSLVWDLGANDGTYSRILAETSDYVLAVDSDDVTVDVLYRSLRDEGPTNVLPLCVDLTDPSPARGWRGRERRAFTDRGTPDLVLALALVHHLAIAANVPLPEVVDWFRSMDATIVVEFVEPDDPMAQRLLGNKPPGLFAEYHRHHFERLLSGAFDIRRSETLPSQTRTLYLCEPH